MKNKPSKRNLEWSESNLLHTDEHYRCESLEGEVNFPNYWKLDTTDLTPAETAARIKEHFDL